MACNKDLQADGKAYPRTCADCGLGPCKKYAEVPGRVTPKQLAVALMAMNYGDLRSVASDLSKMIDKEVRPKVETCEEFAELLFDWAEATAHD